MNIQRFIAPTSREALGKARMTFGEGTLILSNRPVPGGVEVVATAEDTLSTLDQGHAAPQPALQARSADSAPPAKSLAARLPAPTAPELDTPVAQDAEQLAMSTLSFQDYVRERMLRRRHEALAEEKAERAAKGAVPLGPATQMQMPMQMRTPPQAAAVPRPQAAGSRVTPPRPAAAEPAAQRIQHALPFVKEVIRSKPAAGASAPPIATTQNQGIVGELQAMKELIEDRFNTLAWLGQARQDPIQSNLMLKLIRAGYSPGLARAMLERLPAELSASDAMRWIVEVLQRNLKTDEHEPPIHLQGGMYALVGATGVGKTTTAAKLAAHCVQAHGASSVGLITLDTYRVGAHEQLRAYGRMLGVVAHLAHDRAALQDMLALLANKKMVLIDTTGIAPRDPRKQGMLDVLDLPGLQRLLVVNAGGHGDTLDDVMGAFKTSGVQQAILSKVDEAVKLGPALDATVRHQLLLRGVCNGQRVPEDFERADAAALVAASMRSNVRSAFDPKPLDLTFFFSPSGETALRRESAHA